MKLLNLIFKCCLNVQPTFNFMSGLDSDTAIAITISVFLHYVNKLRHKNGLGSNMCLLRVLIVLKQVIQNKSSLKTYTVPLKIMLCF